jgi:hypothetical protein
VVNQICKRGEGGLKLKKIIEATHEPLPKLPNMAMVRNCDVYVGTNPEPLCVEFSNFVQCHIFVNCLAR